MIIYLPFKVTFPKRWMTRENAFNNSEVTKQYATLSKQYDFNYIMIIFTEERVGGNTSTGHCGSSRLYIPQESIFFSTLSSALSPEGEWVCTGPFSHPFTPCTTSPPPWQAPDEASISSLADPQLCSSVTAALLFLEPCGPLPAGLQVSAQMSSERHPGPSPHPFCPLLCFPFLHATSTRYITYYLLTNSPPTRM